MWNPQQQPEKIEKTPKVSNTETSGKLAEERKKNETTKQLSKVKDKVELTNFQKGTKEALKNWDLKDESITDYQTRLNQGGYRSS